MVVIHVYLFVINSTEIRKIPKVSWHFENITYENSIIHQSLLQCHQHILLGITTFKKYPIFVSKLFYDSNRTKKNSPQHYKNDCFDEKQIQILVQNTWDIFWLAEDILHTWCRALLILLNNLDTIIYFLYHP